MLMETQRICPSCRKPLAPEAPLGLCPECLLKSGLDTVADTGGGAPTGSGFVPPSVAELAKLFPQLEVLEFVGKGGMGAVYKARQPSLDRLVALKILPPTAAGDPGFAERFNREARALARLNHPNIVTVHDFGQAGALHYLVMEFLDGGNLRQVESSGRLTPEQALAIVPQICEALQFAHNEGIIHRDIKPENILLDTRGRVKITDFGIAKILGRTAAEAPLTGARDVVGTPNYMAPEQIEKPRTVDHRADIYSLGVVFYEMLTGELPLGKFAPPSRKVQVDVRLDEVVLHALEKEPRLRYQQASEVKTAIETIAQSKGPVPPPEAGPPPAPDAEALEREGAQPGLCPGHSELPAPWLGFGAERFLARRRYHGTRFSPLFSGELGRPGVALAGTLAISISGFGYPAGRPAHRRALSVFPEKDPQGAGPGRNRIFRFQQRSAPPHSGHFCDRRADGTRISLPACAGGLSAGRVVVRVAAGHRQAPGLLASYAAK